MSTDECWSHLTGHHRIDSSGFIDRCRATLETTGVLVLEDFFAPDSLAKVLEQSEAVEADSFFTESTHNVYLTPPDTTLSDDHTFNVQVTSTKGCICHDQVAADSPLRDLYDSETFRNFLCGVLDIDSIHPYADSLSGINVHFHRNGQELGWHFDNSSFAVTVLIRGADSGGEFQFVPGLRASDDRGGNDRGENPQVRAVLENQTEPETLKFNPGALVVFRGRQALHRVTPTRGATTRVLAVFAYNTEPNIALSASARRTFYGRLN